MPQEEEYLLTKVPDSPHNTWSRCTTCCTSSREVRIILKLMAWLSHACRRHWMLQRATTNEGKDWDRLIPYLLVVYQEPSISHLLVIYHLSCCMAERYGHHWTSWRSAGKPVPGVVRAVHPTILVTGRNSDKFRIILLKVAVITCESRCRSAAPILRTTCTDSAKDFKFPLTMDLTHYAHICETRLRINHAGFHSSKTSQKD